jgi:uncharacterized membrane protein YhaH (DUF805 family)
VTQRLDDRWPAATQFPAPTGLPRLWAAGSEVKVDPLEQQSAEMQRTKQTRSEALARKRAEEHATHSEALAKLFGNSHPAPPNLQDQRAASTASSEKVSAPSMHRYSGSSDPTSSVFWTGCGVRSETGDHFCFECGSQLRAGSATAIDPAQVVAEHPASSVQDARRSMPRSGTIGAFDNRPAPGAPLSPEPSFAAKAFIAGGRANRLEYAGGRLLILMGMVIAGNLAVVLAETAEVAAIVLLSGVILLGFWLGFSLDARRLHDLGHSGWYVMLGFLPIVNVAAGLYCLFSAGQPGPNQYGLSPDARKHQRKVLGVVLILSAIAVAADRYCSLKSQVQTVGLGGLDRSDSRCVSRP